MATMIMSVRQLDEKTYALPLGTKVHLAKATSYKPSFGVSERNLFYMGNDGVGAIFSTHKMCRANTSMECVDYLHYTDVLEISDESFT